MLSDRKFGKTIQKRQLEIPEYAASFVDYKALKKVSEYPDANDVFETARLSVGTAHQDFECYASTTSTATWRDRNPGPSSCFAGKSSFILLPAGKYSPLFNCLEDSSA